MFLIPYDREPRRPLKEWAIHWRAWIAQQPTDCEVDFSGIGEIAKCLNQVALIESIRGSKSSAESLCWSQIEWIKETMRRTGETSMLTLSLQPWINIGRLLALAGQTHEALDHFRIVHYFDTRSLLNIGPIEITSQDWREMCERNTGLRGHLETIFVIESLKALVMSGDVAGVHSFMEDKHLSPMLTPFCQEARLLTFVRTGELDRGLEYALSVINSAVSWERLVYGVYLCEILIQTRPQAGSSFCKDLLEWSCIATTQSLTLPQLLIVSKIVRLAASIHVADNYVYDRAELLLDYSTCFDDEPLELLLLQCMVLSSTEEWRAYWNNRHNDLAQSSYYATINPHPSRNESDVALFDSLKGELLALLSREPLRRPVIC